MDGTVPRASPALATAFGGLPGDALSALTAAAHRHHLDRGAYLFRRGDPAPSLFVVERGSLKVSALDPDGREILLAIAAVGAVVGDLLEERQAFDGRAGEPTVVLALSPAELRRTLGVRTADRLLLGVASSRADDLARALLQVTRTDTRRRIAARVCDLADRHGRDVPEGRRLEVTVTQDDLGKLAGTSRETANKAVAHLSRRGWLARRGGRYVVVDGGALADFATGGYPSSSGPPPPSSQSQV